MNISRRGNQFGESNMSFSSPGAGGGFLDKTFGDITASQDKKSGRRTTRVVPVTTAIINNAVYGNASDCFELDEVWLNEITFIGMIKNVVEGRTNLTFEIDDLTGKPVTVKRWLDQEDDVEYFQESKFREDTYVRVFGYIKKLDDGQKLITAFAMRRVTDFNELTYHMFAVIHAMTVLKKIQQEENNPNTQFGNTSFSAGGNQFGRGSNNGMDMNSKTVLEVISEASGLNDEGISMSDLIKRLNMPERTVREIVEHLNDEGHVYPTTDDEHFRCTNA